MTTGFIQVGSTSVGSCEVGTSRAQAESRNVLLHVVMLACFCLLFSIISADIFTNILPKVKLVLRFGTFAMLIIANLICIPRTSAEVVSTKMIGFGLFFLYAMASIKWSPIPMHTAQQLFSLGLMLLFSITIARLTNSDRHVSIVLFYLVAMLLLRSTIMVLCYIKMGDAAIARGTVGQLWHSTDAADTAGIGLTLLIGSWFLLKLAWSRLLVLPGLFSFFALMAVAHNRFVLVITPLVLILILLFSRNIRYLFWMGFIGALLVPLLLIYDAHSGAIQDAVGVTETIASRDESAQQSLASFSGRDELWAIIWDEYQHAKIFGHGFMSTSREGEFYCWYAYANYDAHNQFLHVLVTTGIIGTGFFLIALAIPAVNIFRNLFAADKRREFARLCLFAWFWLFLWGLLNVSFSGYINSSMLVFYGLLGLIIGRLR